MTNQSLSASNTRSVSKALSILSTFNDSCRYQRVSDIATKLGLNTSTVSRHLATMLDCGYLDRNDETGCYYLGPQIITLAGVALNGHEVYRHARTELGRLAHDTGVHCGLGIPRDDSVVHLASAGGEQTTEMLTPLGYHHPMYCSAMGRVFLAFMPQDQAQTILRSNIPVKYTGETKTGPSELAKILAQTRKQGYAVIVNELISGRATIAAPVFDHNRNVIAAISMTGEEINIKITENEAVYASQLMKTASKISSKLGYFAG